jgi:hypothetical protein
MTQLSLFPPPGAIKEPLPNEVLLVARELLAELLVVVVENTIAQEPIGMGGTDE